MNFKVIAIVLGTACLELNAFAATLFVWQGSPNPAPPYSSWDTAAHLIQEAVDESTEGDTVLVTNGVYAAGARVVTGLVLNRVVVDRTIHRLCGSGQPRASPALLKLGNGSHQHSGCHRCRRSSRPAGLGPGRGVVTNCVLVNNLASQDGGGVNGGIIYSSIIKNNRALDEGGGADDAILFDCVVLDNQAEGGITESKAYRSLISRNIGFDGAYCSTLENCALISNLVTRATTKCQLTHCTVVGREAIDGAVVGGSMRNCIAYFNNVNHLFFICRPRSAGLVLSMGKSRTVTVSGSLVRWLSVTVSWNTSVVGEVGGSISKPGCFRMGSNFTTGPLSCSQL